MEPVILNILRDWTSLFWTHDRNPQSNVLDLMSSPAILCCFLVFALLIGGFLCFKNHTTDDTQKIPNWLSYLVFLCLTQIGVLLFLFLEFLITLRIPSALGKFPILNGIHSMFYLIPFLFIISAIILFFQLKKKFPEDTRTRWTLSIFHLIAGPALFIFLFGIHGFYMNYINDKFPPDQLIEPTIIMMDLMKDTRIFWNK